MLLCASVALAQSEPAQTSVEETGSDEEEEEPLRRHRSTFDALAERTIGTASKPVEFNWRRSDAMIAATGGFVFELNNFNTLRGGGMLRLPSGGTLFEVGVSWTQVWDSPSSRLLAFTPYRQPGRPPRLELDLALVLPLAEGVVTTSPKFFPAVQLVFNAYAGFRYMVHPTGWGGMRPREVVGAIFAPNLSDKEVENLEGVRLDSMQTDLGRYGLLLGLGNDIYFKQGVFLSPRIMLAVPILAPATQTELLFWADFTLAVGVAL